VRFLISAVLPTTKTRQQTAVTVFSCTDDMHCASIINCHHDLIVNQRLFLIKTATNPQPTNGFSDTKIRKTRVYTNTVYIIETSTARFGRGRKSSNNLTEFYVQTVQYT